MSGVMDFRRPPPRTHFLTSLALTVVWGSTRRRRGAGVAAGPVRVFRVAGRGAEQDSHAIFMGRGKPSDVLLRVHHSLGLRPQAAQRHTRGWKHASA